MLSDKRIRAISEGRCDYSRDERGRGTFYFDDNQLLVFAREIVEARDQEMADSGDFTEAEWAKMDRHDALVRRIKELEKQVADARQDERKRCAAMVAKLLARQEAVLTALCRHDCPAHVELMRECGVTISCEEAIRQGILAKLNEEGDKDAEL